MSKLINSDLPNDIHGNPIQWGRDVIGLKAKAPCYYKRDAYKAMVAAERLYIETQAELVGELY